MKLLRPLITVVAAWCVSAAGHGSFDAAKLQGRPNINQTPLGVSGQWSLEKLLALTQKEGIELWSSLGAVPMIEMNGHYLGLRTNADDVEDQKRYAQNAYNEKNYYWLGKGFKPLTDSTGEGYNRFRLPGRKILRNHRFATRMGNSLIDGKPAFIIDFSAFNKQTMLDEVRKLDESIYIGISTTETNGKRSEPDVFILIGPTDEWAGPN